MVIMGLDQKILWSLITMTPRFKRVDQFHLSMCIKGMTLLIKASLRDHGDRDGGRGSGFR